MVCAPSEFIQQNGRQLSSLQKGNNGILYTYDSSSTRKTKTVNGVKYTYQYINGKLIHETRGEKSFHYYYDTLGYLTAIKYRLTTDGSEYAYYATHNSRGDVLGLYNGNGALVAQYEYDSWGNVLSIKNAAGAVITDQNHVGNLNAIRYRGYYQDTETGLYYLMSRYYDPVTHRFVNADGYFQSGDALLDVNMNAYCRNNPVNSVDYNGAVVFVWGYEGGACAGAGIQGSIVLVSDLHGNVGIQTSYTGFDVPPTVASMGVSAGQTIGVVWDADTIYDLEQPCEVVGASFKEFPYVGGSLVHFDDSPDDEYDGFYLSAGIGASLTVIDPSISKPKTQTVWSTNVFGQNNRPSTNQPSKNKKNKPATKKKTSCSGCGKPIGYGPGKCAGGW